MKMKIYHIQTFFLISKMYLIQIILHISYFLLIMIIKINLMYNHFH